jgi:hypothetical protein
MPDSVILLALTIIIITVSVLWHRDSYLRGQEEGYNKGYKTAKNYYTRDGAKQ